jgi:hypothetical protein
MLLAAALVPAGCASGPPAAPKPVPVRLLQYLGSSDPTGHGERSAGGTWLGYLSQLKLKPPPKSKAPASTVAANRKAGS